MRLRECTAVRKDEKNRLQSVTGTDVSESYAYDADGNRIKKVSNGVTTRTFFPGLYEEEQVTVWPYTTTAVKHYSFNGMRIAISDGGTLRYIHGDHLSSSSVETNSSGASTAARTYYAYGSTRSSSGTLQTDRTYTGQKQDGTGLHYYNARYYDSSLGVFLSPDTLVPDAGQVVDYNRFLYVRGNPLKYSDPSGHCATTTNGEPDMDGDGECWQMANAIAGLGYTEQGFWDDWGGKNRSDWWLNNIANQSFATLEYLTPFYERYQSEFEGRTGLRRLDSLEPVVNPELRMPGDTLVKTAVKDVVQCGADFPMGCATAADDAALVVASAGVLICASATGGSCLTVVGGASTLLGGTGATITTGNAVRGDKANWGDAIISWVTTGTGGAFGGKLEGVVGVTISLGQRIYDEWSSRR